MTVFFKVFFKFFLYLREVHSVDEPAPRVGRAGAARNGYCGY